MNGSAVPPLGIGLPYIAALPADLYKQGVVDFVEITPETVCRQRGVGHIAAIEIVPEQVELARRTCDGLPMVVHGVELSIGSAHGWNEAYLRMLDAFQATWPFEWHSEHLGFQTIEGDDSEPLEIGVPLPLPATREAVEMIEARSSALLARYGVPFLLENPAHYFADYPADPEIGDDIGLMHAISKNGACRLLLDLHNVHCNAVNHKFDPFAALDRMPLDRVVELHIAGGSWHDGFWMDAHDGRVPEQVWDMLQYALPRIPNAAGIVFEMLEEHAVRLGADTIREELNRARDIWNACRSE